MLRVRENEISLRKWSGGTAQLHNFKREHRLALTRGWLVACVSDFLPLEMILYVNL